MIFFWEKWKCFIVLVDAINVGKLNILGKDMDQWKVLAKEIDTDREVQFLITIGLDHYGPKLYDENCYI